MTQPYRYIPLSAPDSLRLVKLHPAHVREDPIRISLCEISLACHKSDSPDRAEYEALSYVWGPIQDSRHIKCEQTYISVTSNCESALRHLRWRTRSRTLWVDAICIDQASVEDKEHQVKRMGDIYSCAMQVIVWLGDTMPGTLEAFQHLRKLAQTSMVQEPLPVSHVSMVRWLDMLPRRKRE